MQSGLSKMGLSKKKDKNQKRGPARDRTGIVGIRIQSDNHYTTEPRLMVARRLEIYKRNNMSGIF